MGKILPTCLYRGDSISKNPSLGIYRSAGLLTGLSNGGNPAYVDKNGVLESVRAHVKANNVTEEFFQTHSHFFSLTENKNTARYYASFKCPNELIASDDYSETRYIFTLHTAGIVPIERQKGLYSLKYSCDPSLIRSDNRLSPDLLFDPLTAMINLKGNKNCEGCNNGRLSHHLLLIDVVTFLEAVPSTARFADSLVNAKKDSEWLVMPIDYIPHLYGNSARIPRSQIWFAEHYRLRSESPRDSSISENGNDMTDFD